MRSVAFGQPEMAANNGPANRQQMGRPGGRGMGPMGGPGMPGGPNRVAMVFDGGNLYVLQAGELVKYDAATLKEEGAVQIADRTTAAPAGNDRPQPPAGAGPAALLISDGNILLVAGSTFYRIDGKTMKIAKQTALPTPDQQQGGMRPPMGQPQLELGGKSLFVVTGNRLYSIDIAGGKVTGQVELKLPAPPQGRPGMGPGGQGGPPPFEGNQPR
ncbi:MAG: YncE family protein [Armatimonadota bacterium]